jgi:Predicted nucleotidyltransferase
MINLKGLSDLEKRELIPDDLIFLGYRGSIAHGMYVPNTDPNSIDDKDIIGVYILPASHYIGINKSKEVREKWYKEWDCVYYDFLKIVSLLCKGNPNVLSSLWLDDKYILYQNDSWRSLVEIRDAFTCKNVYHSFCGYAHSQFHRMTHMSYDGYMGEKRKLLVDKYGYDCKNAAHLIRLLRMGIEFLAEGTLYVERQDDATQLLEIKRGEWTLEQVKTESERLFNLCDEVYIKSTLRETPDFNKIDSVCKDILYNRIRSELG